MRQRTRRRKNNKLRRRGGGGKKFVSLKKELVYLRINMHNLRAKNKLTGTGTMTSVGNRMCIITLRLTDFKSQTCLSLTLDTMN